MISEVHQKLATLCVSLALLQIVVGLFVNFPMTIGYIFLCLSFILIIFLWISLFAIRDKISSRATSLGFYIFTRYALYASFILIFLCPVVSWFLFHDKFRFVMISLLGIYSFFLVLLASWFYGRSFVEQISQNTD